MQDNCCALNGTQSQRITFASTRAHLRSGIANRARPACGVSSGHLRPRAAHSCDAAFEMIAALNGRRPGRYAGEGEGVLGQPRLSLERWEPSSGAPAYPRQILALTESATGADRNPALQIALIQLPGSKRRSPPPAHALVQFGGCGRETSRRRPWGSRPEEAEPSHGVAALCPRDPPGKLRRKRGRRRRYSRRRNFARDPALRTADGKLGDVTSQPRSCANFWRREKRPKSGRARFPRSRASGGC